MNIDIKDRDQMFSKLIDSIELKKEDDEWSSIWQEAWDELSKTMSDEHIELILNEQKKIDDGIISFRDGECHHLYYIAGQMVFFHCQDKIRKSEQKNPLYLPPHVAQIYIDNDCELPTNICDNCGYWIFYRGFKECPNCGI